MFCIVPSLEILAIFHSTLHIWNYPLSIIIYLYLSSVLHCKLHEGRNHISYVLLYLRNHKNFHNKGDPQIIMVGCLILFRLSLTCGIKATLYVWHSKSKFLLILEYLATCLPWFDHSVSCLPAFICKRSFYWITYHLPLQPPDRFLLILSTGFGSPWKPILHFM